ncbi:MAG: apolipoprotein N-acyltransferase [Planctomycetota bacterium]|nr:MAG: apolipoprotein N-acyltransferase [Planctomycetota bacterium]
MKRKQVKQPEENRKPLTDKSPIRLIGGQYVIEHWWPLFVLTGLTYLLSLPMFAPLSFWPVGYIVFAPWLVAVCISRYSVRTYFISFLLGFAFFLTHLRWMYVTTPEGYVAGSFYLAVGFLLAAWLIRHLYCERDLSVAVTFPVIWTAIELLRSYGPLAFPWFLLGHSQIRLLTMIQIADLTGVFGVTFMLAVVNGWLVDLMLRPILIWSGTKATSPRHFPVGTVLMIMVLGATVIYGRSRLGVYKPDEGPRIAVLQGDFVLKTSYDPQVPTDEDKQQTYLDLFDKALVGSPDMIVLPETPWTQMSLNREIREVNPRWGIWHHRFVELSAEHKSYIVVGSLSEVPQPEGHYPELHRYNSAFVYTPNFKEPDRYDKIHLVLFGEYVPFRYSIHWLYRFLNDGPWNPWGRNGYEYSLTAGQDFKVFPMQARSQDGQAYNFAITICYEDVIPQIFRKFIVDTDRAKRVDFMLNISNDGWFGRGVQQPQHLVSCAFRAIENRVGIARAVNTGVSGFIDSDGSWHDLVVEPGRGPHAGGTGYRIARVDIDREVTFYSVYGDLFAQVCGILAFVALIDAVFVGFRKRRSKQQVSTDGDVK